MATKEFTETTTTVADLQIGDILIAVGNEHCGPETPETVLRFPAILTRMTDVKSPKTGKLLRRFLMGSIVRPNGEMGTWINSEVLSAKRTVRIAREV